ncbi:MAG: T9SS type A sorting domain-containing protein [Salinivirgaceae bacterium]|nr:T9SS type A sorting domain-containing protein [Salinivirgaceae bacterium]
MKKISITILTLVLFATPWVSRAQMCFDSKAIGGTGTQFLYSPREHNGNLFAHVTYGQLDNGKRSMFTIDGQTFPHRTDDAFDTHGFMKLNSQNSLEWFLYESNHVGDDGIGIYDYIIDAMGNVYFFMFLSGDLEQVTFGGHQFNRVINEGVFQHIVAKFSNEGQYLWSRQFNMVMVGAQNSIGFDGDGNVVIPIELSGSQEFYFSNWDPETQTIECVEGYTKSHRLIRISSEDGSYISNANLSAAFDVAPEDANDVQGLVVVRSPENMLVLKLLQPINYYQHEKLLIETFNNGASTFELHTEQGTTTLAIVKNHIDNTYYRVYRDSDNLSCIDQFDGTLSNVLNEGRFSAGDILHNIPVVDNVGNVVFNTSWIINRDDEQGTHYNGQSLYVDGWGGSYTERFIYLNSDLTFKTQKVLGYDDSNKNLGQILYTPDLDLIRCLGNSFYARHFDAIGCYTPDYDAEIMLFSFDNSAIVATELTLSDKTDFTVDAGNSKDFSVTFDSESFVIRWLVDNNEVATTPDYTFDVATPGEYELKLVAYDENLPEKSFIKTWNATVVESEFVELFSNDHPLYNNNILYMAVDTVDSYLWAVDPYAGKIYHIDANDVSTYETFEDPAGIDFTDKTIKDFMLDGNQNLYFVTEDGYVFNYTDNQWNATLLSDLGFEKSPNRLYWHSEVLYIATNLGVVTKSADFWDTVPNVKLYSNYHPTSTSAQAPTRNVRALAANANGDFFAGLEYGLLELNTYDSVFPQAWNTPFDNVFSMTASGDVFYMGNVTYGITSYNPNTSEFKSYTHFSEYYDVSSINVQRMKTDALGRIWFVGESYSTGPGIFCFNPENDRFIHYVQDKSVNSRFALGKNGTVYMKANSRWGSIGTAAIQSGGQVTFTVSHSEQPVEGATISIAEETLTTDIAGQAQIALDAGTYSFTVSHNDFETYSGPVTVENDDVTVNIALNHSLIEEGTLKDILLYPNPTSGLLYVQFVNSSANNRITVYNTSGALLTETVCHSLDTTIDLSPYKGLVFIQIISNQTSRTYRIIVN